MNRVVSGLGVYRGSTMKVRASACSLSRTRTPVGGFRCVLGSWALTNTGALRLSPTFLLCPCDLGTFPGQHAQATPFFSGTTL